MSDQQPTHVMDLFHLDDHVAIISGGSRGLGKSMALALAQAGATTILCSRHQEACDTAAEELAEKTGQTSLGMAMDVTDKHSVASVFGEVMNKFGRLDVLINSAGINIRHPIEGFSLEECQQVIDTNLTGTWLCCRAAAPVMKAQRYGSVINVGSALSGVGLAERTPYCASKAGVVGMTQVLALEWAESGVRCNVVCPGPFLTEMNKPLLKDPVRTAAVVGQTALNRWAELHEIQGIALFLASPASTYVTGAALYIDGGWTAR